MTTTNEPRVCRECGTTTCSRRPGYPYCYGTAPVGACLRCGDDLRNLAHPHNCRGAGR